MSSSSSSSLLRSQAALRARHVCDGCVCVCVRGEGVDGRTLDACVGELVVVVVVWGWVALGGFGAE